MLFKEGFSCLIVGGGQVAARKLEVLLHLRCAITVVAPRVAGSIDREVQDGSIRWLKREYASGDCTGFQLVIAATPVRDINRSVSDEARGLGIPVNVVDDPALSTVIFPAIWREKSLLVAVSTEGVAPFIAAEIRNRIAGYAKGMGRWVETAGKFRETVRGEIDRTDERESLYRRFLDLVKPEEAGGAPAGGRLNEWLRWLDDLQKK